MELALGLSLALLAVLTGLVVRNLYRYDELSYHYKCNSLKYLVTNYPSFCLKCLDDQWVYEAVTKAKLTEFQLHVLLLIRQEDWTYDYTTENFIYYKLMEQALHKELKRINCNYREIIIHARDEDEGININAEAPLWARGL